VGLHQPDPLLRLLASHLGENESGVGRVATKSEVRRHSCRVWPVAPLGEQNATGPEGSRMYPDAPSRARGGAAWGYVSCRNALSESGSLVTVSMRKRGDESLNPLTMQ
jgi:hypothetical protein